MADQTVFTPRYELVWRKNPLDENEHKWYAKSKSNGTVGTEALVQAIKNRCTVTRHDAKAVLSALQEVIIEYVKMGCSVRLDDLGYLRLECSGKGSLTADAFTTGLIENTMLRFQPADALRTEVKNLTSLWQSGGIAEAEQSQAQYKKEQTASGE